MKERIAGVKLTDEQYRLIESRASQRGVSMSAWMRSVLVQAASKPMGNSYLRIREPDGVMV